MNKALIYNNIKAFSIVPAETLLKQLSSYSYFICYFPASLRVRYMGFWWGGKEISLTV